MAFASCSVAQELTDDQIDQEGASDEEVRGRRVSSNPVGHRCYS